MHITKQQILNQQLPDYQHSEGTCLCGVCLCGNCVCRQQPVKQQYVGRVSSIYETDFRELYNKYPPSKPIIIEEPKRIRAFSQHSIYSEDYTAKDQQSPVHPDRPQLPQVRIPFAGCNSYALQFPNKSTNPPSILKPVDQIHLLPAKMESLSQYQREYKLRQMNRQSEFSNISKIMNKRLHISSKDKMAYSSSSYQESYQGRQSMPTIKVPKHDSSMVFGISNVGLNPLISQSRCEFSNKRFNHCEANDRLLEMCRKL